LPLIVNHVDRLQRLTAWMARGSVAASIFAVIIFALTIAEFARPRERVARGSSIETGDVLIPLRPGSDMRIRHSLGRDVEVITDKSETINSQLLGAAIRQNHVTISPLSSGPAEALTRPVAFEMRFQPSSVQVGAFGGVDRQVAFAMADRRNRILVEEHDLGRGGRVLDRIVSAIVGRAIRAQRDLRIGTWSGTRPDLFVIDRGQPNRTMRIRILSGESRFQKQLLDVTAPHQGAGFPQRQWSVDVGRVGSGRPDIILVTRYAHTGSGSTEVHVLSGDTKYSEFRLEVPSVLPGGAGEREMVFGYRNGAPTWFSVVKASGRVQPFTLP
jgi:hypothetical protein